MRRPLALLALFVTTWSNAAVLRCSSMAPASRESHASAEYHEHAAHAAQAPRASHETGPAGAESGPGSHPHTQGCGLAMACGTALGGTGATLERDLPGSLTETLQTSAAAPTTADLSREPPPPRRLA